MSFSLNMGSWNSVFAVPRELITKHLKLCSSNELKFILWLFANPDTLCENEQISKETGIPVSLIEDCAEYWCQVGLIKTNQNQISASEPLKPAPIVEQNDVRPMQKMLRPDSIYIAKRLGESPNLSHLFQDVEGTLGKTLSPSLSAILVIAHDDYCLPSEVILMLISYCASIQKTSTGYIENLAKKWYIDGVNTLALAENAIRELDAKSTAWKKIVSVLGIPYRKPIKTEEELAVAAVLEMKFSDEMIKLCYEKCIQGTGKFQAKYMKKIFESWYAKKLCTVLDVEMAEAARAPKVATEARETSYDLSEFHRLNVFNFEEDDE